jgi:hypothetical protein
VLVVLVLTAVSTMFAQQVQSPEEVTCESIAHVPVPKYRIGQNLGGTTTSDTFILSVSVKPSDVSKEKMMALSCKLASLYGAFDAFILQVFDEHMAAVLYTVGGVEMPYPRAGSKIRAIYDIDRRKGTSWFKWFAEGGDWVRAENFVLVPTAQR